MARLTEADLVLLHTLTNIRRGRMESEGALKHPDPAIRASNIRYDNELRILAGKLDAMIERKRGNKA